MSDLVLVTGLEKGVIYNHFGSKEELALEAFDYAAGIMRERFREALETEGGALERLFAVIDVLGAVAGDPPVAGGCPQGRRERGRGDAGGGRHVDPAPRRPGAHAEGRAAPEGPPALPGARGGVVGNTGRTRTVRWEDPAPGAEAAREMSGLEYLRAMMRGELPGPPIAGLLGFGFVEVEEGRVVFGGEPPRVHHKP